ncbi:hypothetical protein Q8G71_36090, partial [Klebsiella pneumoniae]
PSNCFCGITRGFHVKAGPLGFKASCVTTAQAAVAVDEERGADEGLEIAKLALWIKSRHL